MYQGKIPSGNYESFELSDDNKKNLSKYCEMQIKHI